MAYSNHSLVPLYNHAIGDIITIAGVNAFVSDTIADVAVTEPIPSPQLDPPTISMTFGVNDAPTAGKEGKFITFSHIKQRLERECEVSGCLVSILQWSVLNKSLISAFNRHGRTTLLFPFLLALHPKLSMFMDAGSFNLLF